MWPGRRRAKRTTSTRLLMALQSFDKENPSYTSAVLDLAGSGSVSVLQARDLADALQMGLGGSLVVVSAVLISLYASSLPRVAL